MTKKHYIDFLKSKEFTSQIYGFDINDINPKLFPFQKAIVKWSLLKGKSCIFADTGLGKTMMQVEWAYQVHKYNNNKNVLIIAPLAVSQQTIRESKKIDREVKYITCSEEITTKGLYITNYERIDNINMDDFCGVVLDESSILKHQDSKTRKKIIDKCIKIGYKLSCTATPSPNDYMELGSQCEFLGIMDANEMLAMFFTHNSGETQKWRLKGHAEDIFFEWMATWSTFIKKPSDIGNYDDTGYILPKLNLIEHVVKTDKNIINYLSKKGKLGLSGRNRARRDTLFDRVKYASDIANNIDGYCIAWCNLNDESSELKDNIINGIEIRGSQSIEIKKNNILDFTEGKIYKIITKPSIAGFGMNWQHCNNMLFVGLNDSYEDLYQSIRRCWRFGQTKQVNVHIIISDLEGEVLVNIKRKNKQIEYLQEKMIEKMSNFQKREISGTGRMEYIYKKSDTKSDKYEIMLGDSCDRMKEIDDNSIDYSIFSPPFPSLYTYTNSQRDLGNNKTKDGFNDHFRYILKELYRIIMEGRVVSVHCMNIMLTKSRDGVIGIHDFRGDIIKLFQEEGFVFHSEVTIWKNPVVAMQRTKALGLLWKQIKKDSARCRQGMPDYVLTFRKGDGKNNIKPIAHTEEEFPVDIWQQYASPCWNDINQSNTLNYRIARTESDERHIAPLQLDLISRCIDLWSAKDDIVFSPFMGIGSEGYVSLLKGRKFKGIELKESYYEWAKKNIHDANLQYGECGDVGDIVNYKKGGKNKILSQIDNKQQISMID